MKTVTLVVRVQVSTANEDKLENVISTIETPYEDEDGAAVNHFIKYGYEIMIMNRDDRKIK